MRDTSARDALDRRLSAVDADLDRIAAEQAVELDRDEALYRASRPHPLPVAIVALILAVGFLLAVCGLYGLLVLL